MSDKQEATPSAFESSETKASRWVIPRFAGIWIWAETVSITALAMLFSALADPADPFHVHAQFPWPWFAPILVALRYGVMPGIVAAAMLLLGWYGWAPKGPDEDLPKLYFLGGLLLTMACGEYSGLWRTRLRRLTELNLYLEDRVERVTKRFYLLRLSHDRLEQDMFARPTTLRDALAELRRRIAASTATSSLPGAQILLEFLAQTCQLEVAAIYEQEKDPLHGFRRVAAIGTPPPLETDDALLAHAQANGTLAHVQSAEMAHISPGTHLVIAPIVSTDKQRVGVLAVSRMPFFAMTEETLQTLMVLLSAYADGVTAATQVLPLVTSYPGLPLEFAEELVKLMRLQREFDLTSHIVVLEFDDRPSRLDMFNQVLRQRRTPDIIWSIENHSGRSIMITLMPLAGSASVNGYLLRTEQSLQEIFGGNFQDLGILVAVIALTDPKPLDAVNRILARRK